MRSLFLHLPFSILLIWIRASIIFSMSLRKRPSPGMFMSTPLSSEQKVQTVVVKAEKKIGWITYLYFCNYVLSYFLQWSVQISTNCVLEINACVVYNDGGCLAIKGLYTWATLSTLGWTQKPGTCLSAGAFHFPLTSRWLAQGFLKHAFIQLDMSLMIVRLIKFCSLQFNYAKNRWDVIGIFAFKWKLWLLFPVFS